MSGYTETELHREYRSEERLMGYGVWCYEKGVAAANSTIEPTIRYLHDGVYNQGKTDERKGIAQMIKDVENNKFYCTNNFCGGGKCGRCALEFILKNLEAKNE